ncbi:MAG: hypothetical protein GYA36_19105 [Veillonellaceae bacterium]|nr:hypothetical protein [Veillonellaceae bacterium]
MCHDGHGHHHHHGAGPTGPGDDLIEISVLDNGTVKVETFGEISEVNHMSAERIMAFLAEHFEGTPQKIRKTRTVVRERERVRR